MSAFRVYADFHNLDDQNRLRLTCVGTLQDLARQGIALREGQGLTFYTDDGDELGQPDELRVDGVVSFDTQEQCWVAAVDWNALRHASEERQQEPPASDGQAAGSSTSWTTASS